MASSRFSGARLDQLLQQAAEPAFWLNSDLKIVWVNRAWEDLTGHTAESVSGLVCRAHGPTRAGDLGGLAGSFLPPPEALAGRPAGTKTLIVHSSGERRWRRVEYWPLHNDKGELTLLLGLVRRIEEPSQSPDSEANRLRVELLEVRGRLLDRYGVDSLIGRGPEHRRLLEQIATAARSAAPVLIVGESGTGKRLLARIIHQLGARRSVPIVPIDCAALPPEVLERTLFGTDDGYAVSDGEPDMPARLALPDGATMLIGDILDLPRDLQCRLARALDDRIRTLATTTSDPAVALRAERLRPDLYYALTTLVLVLRPLRDRLDELPLFAQNFLERANIREVRQRCGFSPEAIKVLLGYDWPGNLRELARVVDDAHSRAQHDVIDVDDLPASIRGDLGAAYAVPTSPPTIATLDELLTQVEKRLIETALSRARHNKSRAAEFLGISRPRLYRRIKELNIPDEGEPVCEPPSAPSSRG
jgi:DNA-binding NtrC family response regulator